MMSRQASLRVVIAAFRAGVLRAAVLVAAFVLVLTARLVVVPAFFDVWGMDCLRRKAGEKKKPRR